MSIQDVLLFQKVSNQFGNFRILRSSSKGDLEYRFLSQNSSVWPDFAKVTTILAKNVAIFLYSSVGSVL
jgi:hypothetical protein